MTYHKRFKATGRKTARHLRAEQALAGVCDPSPAPGAGLWDNPAPPLPDAFSVPMKTWAETTLGGAMDWTGGASPATSTFPFNRLAHYVHRLGYPLDEPVEIARGPACYAGMRGVVSIKVWGREFRDVDGLIFDREA